VNSVLKGALFRRLKVRLGVEKTFVLRSERRCLLLIEISVEGTRKIDCGLVRERETLTQDAIDIIFVNFVSQYQI
jgi:hypothetical protein